MLNQEAIIREMVKVQSDPSWDYLLDEQVKHSMGGDMVIVMCDLSGDLIEVKIDKEIFKSSLCDAELLEYLLKCFFTICHVLWIVSLQTGNQRDVGVESPLSRFLCKSQWFNSGDSVDL